MMSQVSNKLHELSNKFDQLSIDHFRIFLTLPDCLRRQDPTCLVHRNSHYNSFELKNVLSSVTTGAAERTRKCLSCSYRQLKMNFRTEEMS
ncbi:hypothetical protein KP79_PYT20671 [Mizuhopecten yessoensis]|uniref:Uncharacterized protein n=1 Tax=Mizuhopecten yessoensis TaxID=6573 RepID=A0A210QK16_MIZYE|nr:hypothetical protein KP79_PYT20671 [Mizuhopecten yessoensis]